MFSVEVDPRFKGLESVLHTQLMDTVAATPTATAMATYTATPAGTITIVKVPLRDAEGGSALGLVTEAT